MTESAENELLEPGNTELPPVHETLNTEPKNVTIDNEPIRAFYHYDTDGFYLGTTCRQEDNTTDVPFEYEPGFWFFFRNNEWEKVKIPETVSELDFDIILDDNATNYQKTFISLAQRIFAEYSGNEYKLVITDNHYQTIHVSEEDLLKDQYRIEIQQLKKQLSDTDYKAIKYAEGQISEGEYASVRAERQGYRDRINELEGLM